jgi:hypothetical protein
MAAKTPQEWEQGRQLWVQRGYDPGPFEARQQLISQAMTVQDRLRQASDDRNFALEQEKVGIERAKAAQSAPLTDMPGVPADDQGMPDPKAQEEFLSRLDPGTASLVKNIANYQMDISKVTSLRGDQRQRLAQIVSQYDPTFDMTQYPARAAMRKSITSGGYSLALNSANLVIQHLDALSKAAKELNNGNFTPANAIYNAGREMGGNPAITKFKTARDAAASELAKVFKGTGATSEDEIRAWKQNLSENASPAQIQTAIATAVGDLLKSRIDTINTQYQSAMGKPAKFTFLTPHSRQTLTDLGIDPSELDPNETTAAPAAEGGGATNGLPQPGTVDSGYRYKGGNPADPSSWEQVQ